MKDPKKYIGKRIRAQRKIRGWSQEELADRAGRSVYTLSLIERGTNLPNLLTLIELARALECSLDDLVLIGDDARYPSKSSEQRAIEAQVFAEITSMNLKTLKAAHGAIKAILDAQR